jgi:hypothetical protein
MPGTTITEEHPAREDLGWTPLEEALRKLRRLIDDLDPWSAYYKLADLPAAPSLQEAAIELALAEAVEARLACKATAQDGGQSL